MSDAAEREIKKTQFCSIVARLAKVGRFVKSDADEAVQRRIELLHAMYRVSNCCFLYFNIVWLLQSPGKTLWTS